MGRMLHIEPAAQRRMLESLARWRRLLQIAVDFAAWTVAGLAALTLRYETAVAARRSTAKRFSAPYLYTGAAAWGGYSAEATDQGEGRSAKQSTCAAHGAASEQGMCC